MKLLVLGGTHFVGRHIVAQARERGHEVTLFNRGRSDPALFGDLETLIGDREGDYGALRGRRWDAAIDPSGFVPRVMRMTCDALADAVDRYLFVSSAAVYDISGEPERLDEDSPVQVLLDETDENTHRNAAYGALKRSCERLLAARMPGRLLTIRPGLVAGPHDVTDRFTYWPRRIAAGGEVLVAGPRGRPIQVIDVRDLADFAVDQLERATPGTFNVTGDRVTMEHVLDVCRQVTGGDPELVWADDAFLVEQGVTDWTELPLWWRRGRQTVRVSNVSSTRARSRGLRPRPLEQTVRDTWAWDAGRPRPLPRGRVGTRYLVETLTPEREAKLIRLWRERTTRA